MTAIVAYKNKNNIWIGSDSGGIAGSTKTNHGSKLIKKKNYIVGFANCYRVRDVIKEEKSLPKEINSLENIRDFRDLLKLSLIENSGATITSMGEGTLIEHPVDLLLITKIGIYGIENNYQVLKYEDNYAAIGAAQEFSLGALYIAKQLKLDGQQAVTLALKASLEHCTDCAGKIHIQSIKIK